MKKSYVSFLGAVAALAVFASCGSTPKAPATEVEEPVEAPVEEDSAEQEAAADNFKLYGVGILELIHQNVAETPRQVFARFVVAF